MGNEMGNMTIEYFLPSDSTSVAATYELCPLKPGTTTTEKGVGS